MNEIDPRCPHVDGDGKCMDCLLEADSRDEFVDDEDEDEEWFDLERRKTDQNPESPLNQRTSTEEILLGEGGVLE